MDKLSTKDHLLSCIGEESREIQQAVGKALRFGLLDVNPNTGQTNWVDLRNEVHDVIAVFEMLCDEFDRKRGLSREQIKCKKRKLAKYMALSAEKGRISEV